MNAFALHQPERHGLSRWALAGLTIIVAHAAIFAAIALWYARRPAEPNIVAAIAVTLAPVEGSSPVTRDQDIAVGPTMQQADAAPTEPPKEEKTEEQVVQPPTPPHQADVALPRDEPKQVEKPTESRPPAPETRALPKTDHVGQFSEAGAKAYNMLVMGHLQRYKRYPRSAHGASGTTLVQFELNRAGEVIESTVTKSSGNKVLDQEALDTLHRASPFPAFPAAKPGADDSYTVPVTFERNS
ncbi:energy transducer TonB [Bradyrhizobium sp.]|uniref:energy transducer TonB n=1 Tax=Bradyrhizobium sp. TaxID=376 RepID=UPI003C4D5A5E